MSTSRTDTPEYRAFCARAASERAIFDGFRDAPEYRGILDVSAELGEQYRALLHADPCIDDPVLLRYHFQAQEIRERFGPLEELCVLEIGGGFGGLAALLVRECMAYTIIDLPEVRALQDTYLRRKGLALHWPIGVRPDLVVSCYAFSELVPEVQHEYAGRWVTECPRGYLVCNFLGGSLDPDALLALVPGARYEPELPLSHPDNRLMVWGDV